MRRLIQLILVMAAIAPLTGCLGGRPIRYYTVTMPPSALPAAGVYPFSLLIGHISSPEMLQDQPIVYRSGQNEIGVYEYHQWAEPPAQMVKIMLIRRFRASGKFQSVATLGSSVQGEFVLHGRLYDFEEVDKNGSITALVSMEFQLFDRRTHKEVWSHFYSHVQPVQGKTIPDVVAALDDNLEQGLTEVESGLDAYFSGHASGKS